MSTETISQSHYLSPDEMIGKKITKDFFGYFDGKIEVNEYYNIRLILDVVCTEYKYILCVDNVIIQPFVNHLYEMEYYCNDMKKKLDTIDLPLEYKKKLLILKAKKLPLY
jgi:hypothetical protein